MSENRKSRVALIIGGILAAAFLFVFVPLAIGTRDLSLHEKVSAISLFGRSIDIEVVRIKSGGPLTWTGAAVTIGNVISFPRNAYDGSRKGQRQWLIHELTHVWQYQNHGLGYIPRSVWEQMTQKDAYTVHYDVGKSFMEYDIEEQAVIVAEYFVRQDQRYGPYLLEIRGETR